MPRVKSSGHTLIPETSIHEKRMAALIVQRAQLRDLKMVSCAASHDPNQIKHLPPKLAITLNARSEPVEAEGKHLLVVMVAYGIAPEDQQEADNPALKVEVKFLVSYSLESIDGLTQEHYNAFALWVGIYNSWPYLREFVQSMTTRMGLPPLRIPLYTPSKAPFTEPDDDVDQPETEQIGN